MQPARPAVPLDFPVGGLDVSTAFEAQPPQTTPEAVNVRGYDPSTQRLKGGARPGLAKFVAPQLPSGSHLIQCLDTVVWASTDALLDSSESLDAAGGTSGTDDPSTGSRNPGRTVRTGGSGRQPNRNAGNQAGMKFIQKASASTDAFTPDGLRSVSFSSDVGASRLIVCIRHATTLGVSLTISPVSDSQGNSYTNAISISPVGLTFMVISYAITTLPGPCTVSYTPSSGIGVTRSLMTVLEYSNPAVAATLDGTSEALAGDTAWTTGSISSFGTKELALGCFFTARDSSIETAPASITPGTDQGPGSGHNPFTLRSSLSMLESLDYYSLLVLEFIGTAANPSSTQALTGTGSPGLAACYGLGASFKPR